MRNELKRARVWVSVTAMVLAFGACSSGGSDVGSSVEVKPGAGGAIAPDSFSAEAKAFSAASGGGEAGAEAASGSATAPAVTDGRKMVYRADLVVRVSDPSAVTDDAVRIVQKAGGAVFRQFVTFDGDSTLELKVPPARLDAVLTGLSGLGKQLSRQITAADVTAQTVDIDARLASARASAERLRTLLAQAPKVEDLVRIESELAQRESSVESLAAQQRDLAQQVDLATIDLTLSKRSVATPTEGLPGFVGGLRRGAVALIDAGSVALTGLGFALPFVAVVLALWAIVIRPLRRRRRRAVPAASVDSA